MIRSKRVYEDRKASDGARFLVDRLWPRGVRKDSLEIEDWVKEAAPSNDLRAWFRHDPSRWAEFKRRYFRELDNRPDVLEPLLRAARTGSITLLYGARDTERNNAVALKEYLTDKLSR